MPSSIQEAFENAYSRGQEPPTREELSHIFRSWKAIIDFDSDSGEEQSNTPHLVAALLEVECPKLPPYKACGGTELKPEDHFKVSCLDESDRGILVNLAPFAKAYGFDIYVGQSQYFEGGVSDVGDVDLDTLLEAEEEEGATPFDDGDPGEAKVSMDHDAEGEYQEKLTIQHIFSLDGIPMDMVARDIVVVGEF